jgi:RimJ/RimL family protein N-acetyltransferase
MSSFAAVSPIRGVVIRSAVPEDAERLVLHPPAVIEESPGMMLLEPGEFQMTLEKEREFLADFVASTNGVFLIAEAEGQIVGSADCRGGKFAANRHVGVFGIAIRKAWQGRGVGRAMTEAIIGWAKGSGIIRRLELHVMDYNAIAIALYRKVGFVEEGRRRGSICRGGKYFDEILMGMAV